MSESQQTQFISSRNTKTVTSADAAPASPWQGDWEPTREYGYDRILITLSSATTSGLGGTFIFEFSEDSSTSTITETRTIDDFATVRDFDLLNAGKFFRCSFEPDVGLSSNTVIITTQFARGYQGAFVRLGNQEIEEQNAALPQTFAYLKAFRTGGKSIGVTVNRAGQLLTGDSGPEVARGNVAGQTNINFFGRNPDIDTATTPEDLWLGGGQYTGHPTGSPELVEVFSSSTSDTSAGTGARTVRIEGLATSDATAYTTEDLTMNGTTAVTSSGTWYRINKIVVLTAGSGGTNAGTITCRHKTTTANVFAQLAASSGRSAIGAWTVPAATTLFINGLWIGGTRSLLGTPGAFNVALQKRLFGSGAWINIRDYDISTDGAPANLSFKNPILVEAKADLRFRVLGVSDNNTTISAELNGVLFDD